MIGSIAYFPDQCAKNAGPAMEAVLDYLQGSGIATRESNWDCDAVLIWSVLWHGRMQANQQVYQHYRSHNKPVLILEIGSLYRGQTWKVAVNNINAEGFYGHTSALDFDRPKKLGISLATNVRPRPEIIVALQHSKSQQVANLGDMKQWLISAISSIRAYTDRPIQVRPHPRSRIDLQGLPADVSIQYPKHIAHSYDSYDMHFNCHAVVNYNSGVGIQAAIAGVRPVVDVSSLASPVAVDFAHIETAYSVDRDLWLVQICHTEWTLDELRRGTWLPRIATALQ